MAQLESDRTPSDATVDAGWRTVCRIGGVAALILIAYSLATMVQLVLLGGQPTTAAEAFDLLQRNRLVGLLRLDLPTLFVMPLYYLLFFGIYAGLRRADRALAGLATALAFVGGDALSGDSFGSLACFAQRQVRGRVVAGTPRPAHCRGGSDTRRRHVARYGRDDRRHPAADSCRVGVGSDAARECLRQADRLRGHPDAWA